MEVSAPQWSIFLADEYVKKILFDLLFSSHVNMCLGDTAHVFFFETRLSAQSYILCVCWEHLRSPLLANVKYTIQ